MVLSTQQKNGLFIQDIPIVFMHTDTVVFRQTKKLVCTQIQLCLDKQRS